jgi:hypothetical protein
MIRLVWYSPYLYSSLLLGEVAVPTFIQNVQFPRGLRKFFSVTVNYGNLLIHQALVRLFSLEAKNECDDNHDSPYKKKEVIL